MGAYEVETVSVDGRVTAVGSAGPFTLAWPEIAARNSDFLFCRVAIEPNHFHTIQQRSGNRLRHICSRNEQDMRQVEFDIQVMVLEGMILCRIQYFE